MGNRIIIVGGGIVGASTALFCSRHGWDVSLIEKESIGSRASTAAAGILSPPFFLNPEKPTEGQNTQSLLSRKGYDFYPELIKILGEYTESNIGYRQTGMWYLAFNEEEYDEKKTIVREMKKFNRAVSWADKQELMSEIPFLSDDVLGGFLFEEEAHVIPCKLMGTLKTVLKELDVEILENTEVKSVKPNDERSVSVQTETEDYNADACLVSAGCWTADILEAVNIDLPLKPKKGQMVRVEIPDLKGHPPVRKGDRFILPRGNGAILGSTVEDAGEDTSSTIGMIQDLIQSGTRIIPKLNRARFLEAWAGLRPYACKKGGPFLGQVEDTEVYFAAGHYKTGILQGPFTGKLMANYISDRETEIDIERYGLER